MVPVLIVTNYKIALFLTTGYFAHNERVGEISPNFNIQSDNLQESKNLLILQNIEHLNKISSGKNFGKF